MPASTEAVITVRLNTAGAQRDLAALGNALGGAGPSAAAGGGGGGFGLGQLATSGGQMMMGGSPYGTMAGVLGQPTRSTVGSMVSEFWEPKAKAFEQFMLGSGGAGARAAQSAREQTAQAFGMLWGATGQEPPGARQFFQSIMRLEKMREVGRDKIMESSAFRGSASDLSGGAIKDAFQGMMEAWDRMTNKLDNFISGVKVK